MPRRRQHKGIGDAHARDAGHDGRERPIHRHHGEVAWSMRIALVCTGLVALIQKAGDRVAHRVDHR